MKQYIDANEPTSGGIIRNILPGTSLGTADFNYELPQEFIAQSPASPRDSARLMLVDRKTGELNTVFPRYH